MQETAIMEEFEALLEQSFSVDTPHVKSVVKGKVISIDAGQVVIDIGFKVEGRVDLKEFAGPGEMEEVQIGDIVDVYLENVEDGSGLAVISRERARREAAWDRLEKAYDSKEIVDGTIFNKVKGGFTVDLGGAIAFLPGSQVDVRPVRDMDFLMGVRNQFQILKMDRPRNNIVVSRRAILEESRAEQRAEVVNRLQDGDVIEGIVKNVTEYGAFVDLGGVDGLLHVTDMAWGRVSHPTDVVTIGQPLQVKVIKVIRESQRISLGIKQLQEDPWSQVENKFPIGTQHTGIVTNIKDYGAFVELEPGIEGLLHVTEMLWTKKSPDPGKVVSTSQEVEVMVLSTDKDKRQISLGLKQTMENPWEIFAVNYPRGFKLSGTIRNITEFGMFIAVDDDLDGMVHLSDISWDRPGSEAIKDYSKDDVIDVVIIEVNVKEQRIALSIKSLREDPFLEAISGLARGKTTEVTVTGIQDNGIEVNCNGYKAFIRRAELSRERDQQRPEKFATGQKIGVLVSSIDRDARRIGLSIKEMEAAEARDAVSKYSSDQSKSVLGDVLGDALHR